MKKSKIATWLFYYYSISTIFLGLVLIILGPENSLLGLRDNLGVFAIIIPVFIGQITILFHWFTNQANKSKEEMEKKLNVSPNLVRFPPIAVISIFVLAFILRGGGISYDWKLQIDESQFKTLITFGMSILNATTIYLVTLFYHSSNSNEEKKTEANNG